MKESHEFYITQTFITAVHTLPFYLLRAILILPSHLHLNLKVISFSQGPLPELLSLLHATCTTNCILLDLISKIIFSEQYKS